MPRRRRPRSSPAQGSPSAGGREPPRAPSRGAGPRGPEGAPLRPGSLRLTPPRRPAGLAPRPRRLRRPDDPARRASAASRRRSRRGLVGGSTFRIAVQPHWRNRPGPGLTQLARPHSTAPSGERERPGREEDARAAGRRGAAAGLGAEGAREEVSFRTRAPSSSAPGLRTRHPRSCARADAAARPRLGKGSWRRAALHRRPRPSPPAATM